MARPPRLQPVGGIFHITARGNRGQEIFTDERDRERFVRLLEEVVARFGWVCHAYCLMSNHFHLLIETPDANLSRGMHRLNFRYAQWFNHQHGFEGHLFQRRFHSVRVESNWHLIELSRYIVLNPVRAGLCADPGDWPWSSYRAVIAAIRPPRFLTVRWLLEQFGSDPSRAAAAFASFVRDTPRRTRAP